MKLRAILVLFCLSLMGFGQQEKGSSLRAGSLVKFAKINEEASTTRFRGYLKAPLTGEFRFWVASEYRGAFFLGTSENKFTKRELFRFERARHHLAWGERRSQVSPSIQLEAGKNYYFEMRCQGRLRDDEVSLAWSYSEGPGLVNWVQNLGVEVKQSSTGRAFETETTASLAIDGRLQGTEREAWFAETKREINPWWTVTLDQERLVDRVELFNHSEENLATMARLTHYRISLLDSKGELVAATVKHQEAGSHAFAKEYWEVGGKVGSQIKVELLGEEASSLALVEVNVWGRSSSDAFYQPLCGVLSSDLLSYQGAKNDQDDDGFPDDWEIKYGLDPTIDESAKIGLDPDKDGLSNEQEIKRGTHPFQSDSIPGFLTVERWGRIPGFSVGEMIRSNCLSREPDERNLLKGSSLLEMKNESAYRLRGYLTAPTSGEYNFWLSSICGSEFWLSESDLSFGKRRLIKLDPEDGMQRGVFERSATPWHHFSKQRSAPVELQKGKRYYIEILAQYAEWNRPQLSLAWSSVDAGLSEPVVVPASVISSFGSESEDLNRDGLPDRWEREYGLVAQSGRAAQVSRLGEWGDFDNDGLNNREEFRLRTNPTLIDTDGDDLSDREEVRSYFSDPLRDNQALEELVTAVSLGDYKSEYSYWHETEDGLVPEAFRGSLSWDFSVSENSYYVITLQTELLGERLPEEFLALEVGVDEIALPRKKLQFGRDGKALLRIITPFLSAGSHQVTLDVQNLLARRKLSLRSLTIGRPQGLDEDQDGVPDWLFSFLNLENQLTPYQSESRTSPAFLEGRKRLTATLNDKEVMEGASAQCWYMDVPLKAERATEFEVAFEPGISASGEISWQATNIFANEELMVRSGSELKLQVISPNETSLSTPTFIHHRPNLSQTTITLQSERDYHLQQLIEPGLHRFVASHPDGFEGELLVTVRAAQCELRSTVLETYRYNEIVFEGSGKEEFVFDYEGAGLLHKEDFLAGKSTKIALAPSEPGPSQLLIRLHPNGPVLDTIALQAMELSDEYQNTAESFVSNERFLDKRVYTAPLAINFLPEDAEIKIQLRPAGVEFPDGTRSKRVARSDFVDGVLYLEQLYPKERDIYQRPKIQAYDSKGRAIGKMD